MVRRLACAPYVAPLAEVVDRFAFTPERRRLFVGLLDLRRELHELGVVQGFQWLGGSFVESEPSPADVDVVTFFVMPRAWRDKAVRERIVAARPELFRPTEARKRLHCDAYFVALAMKQEMFRQMTLWYGLFSHDRETLAWKGFVEIALDPAGDAAARLVLEAVDQKS